MSDIELAKVAFNGVDEHEFECFQLQVLFFTSKTLRPPNVQPTVKPMLHTYQ